MTKRVMTTQADRARYYSQHRNRAGELGHATVSEALERLAHLQAVHRITFVVLPIIVVVVGLIYLAAKVIG